jgi:acetolactate synthase-1/2/3 large subunit
MNGAECLVATALANDIDTCFVNPGTTELALLTAMHAAPTMRVVLCPFRRDDRTH